MNSDLGYNNMDSEIDNVSSGKVSFEEALDRAGFGFYSYLITAFAGLSIISMVCVSYATTIIAPTSACDLDTTSAQQGFIVAAPIFGLIVGAIIWGRLADLKGRRKMLLVAMMASTIMNAVSSLSLNWIMLMVLQFIAAVCASGQYSMAMALLSESVPMARRNLVILVVASIFLLSQGIMSLMAIPIIPLSFSYHISWLNINWNPWRTLLLVYSIPSLLSFGWLCFMQESPKYFYARGDEESTLKILRVIHRLNNRKGMEELQVKGLIVEKATTESEEQKGAGMSLLVKPPLLKYLVIMTILGVFLKISAFLVWLPRIMNQFVQIFRTGEGRDFTLCETIRFSNENPVENDLPPCALDETSLVLVFAVSCVQSVYNICISLVVNKSGRRNMAIGVAAVSGVSGLIVNAVPNAVASGILFIIFLMGMVLLGLYSAISIALFPTSLRAVTLSVTSTFSRIAMVVMVQVINLLLETNCELAFYIFASLVASSAIVASFLPDDRRLLKPAEPTTLEGPSPQIQQKDDIIEGTDQKQA